MKIAVIGLGKMGGGIARRLLKAGIEVVGYDVATHIRTSIKGQGITVVDSVEAQVAALAVPRVIWLMIPAGEPVKNMMTILLPLLKKNDVIIDGGNSKFGDSQQHAAAAAKVGIHFLDVGVSGGVAGEANGYALMIGGDQTVVKSLEPVWGAVAAPSAWVQVGPAGAGHFVKMVHNAIEYGMMQAMAEGFDLMTHGPYQDIDVAQVAKLWSHGTIVRSFLMELAAKALARDPELKELAAYVEDSGEGRWSVQTAVDHAVPFAVNTAALYARFASRQPDSYATKLVAALRREFGGHDVKLKIESEK